MNILFAALCILGLAYATSAAQAQAIYDITASDETGERLGRLMIPIVFENGFESKMVVGYTGTLDDGQCQFEIISTNGSMFNPKQIIRLIIPAEDTASVYEINHSAKYEWELQEADEIRVLTLKEGTMDIY